MKNIGIILAIASALAFSVGASAEPADFSFLASKDALAVYLVKQVTTGTVEISSATLAGGSIKKSLGWSTPATTTMITSQIDSATAGPITLGNPKDWVSVYVTLKNNLGEELFSGGGGAQATVDGNGKLVLPTIQNNIWTDWQVNIPVGDKVVSASMVVTDPLGGWTRSVENVTVGKGVMSFQSAWAGQGRLTLVTTDGTSVTYDLSNGGGKTASSAKFGVVSQSAFVGFVTATDQTSIVRTIQAYQGQGQNETYEVSRTTQASVKFSVTTSDGAYPVGYWVELPGTNTWSFTAASEKDPAVSITLPAGTSYVIPLWLPEDFRPYDNSGKGG